MWSDSSDVLRTYRGCVNRYRHACSEISNPFGFFFIRFFQFVQIIFDAVCSSDQKFHWCQTTWGVLISPLWMAPLFVHIVFAFWNPPAFLILWILNEKKGRLDISILEVSTIRTISHMATQLILVHTSSDSCFINTTLVVLASQATVDSYL